MALWVISSLACEAGPGLGYGYARNCYLKHVPLSKLSLAMLSVSEPRPWRYIASGSLEMSLMSTRSVEVASDVMGLPLSFCFCRAMSSTAGECELSVLVAAVLSILPWVYVGKRLNLPTRFTLFGFDFFFHCLFPVFSGAPGFVSAHE